MKAFKAVDKVLAEDLLVVVGNWIARNRPVGMVTRHSLGKFALGPRCTIGKALCGLGVFVSNMHMGSVIDRAEVNWSFLQPQQLEISHASTQHVLEGLETYGRKYRYVYYKWQTLLSPTRKNGTRIAPAQ